MLNTCLFLFELLIFGSFWESDKASHFQCSLILVLAHCSAHSPWAREKTSLETLASVEKRGRDITQPLAFLPSSSCLLNLDAGCFWIESLNASLLVAITYDDPITTEKAEGSSKFLFSSSWYLDYVPQHSLLPLAARWGLVTEFHSVESDWKWR